MCTQDYPFAFLNGDYCCKTNQEQLNGNTAIEIESGTCDGKRFSRKSTCCKDNDYQQCPHPEGCFDSNQGMYALSTYTVIFRIKEYIAEVRYT